MKPKTLLVLFTWVGLTLTMRAKETAPPEATAALQDWLGLQPGGVTAAVVDADGVQFHQAGRYSATDSRPVTADTVFEIGSITKVFTALLLADAVEQGKVRLDAPVGAPFGASEVTYAQLATHAAGLPRLPADFAPASNENPYAHLELAQLVASFAAEAARARPGESSYSNLGFAVLGQAVAGAWGDTYAEVLRRRVLEPLGLKDTQLNWRDVALARLAPGHSEAVPTPSWDFAAYAPAGALVSTARELAVFLQFCLGAGPDVGTLRVALEATLVPRAQSREGGGEVGLAWQMAHRDGATVYWHNGGTGGCRSFLAFDRQARRGVVLLTNHTRPLETLGFALVQGRVPARVATTEPARPRAALEGYVGNYPLAPSFVIAITASGEELFLQATGQPRFRLKAVQDERYAVDGVPAEIVFERGHDGKVSALVLHQNGAQQRAPHLPPGALPAPRTEVALTADVLADYVGGYRLGAVEFTLTLEDGKLWAQLTGQPKAPVFASARDEFFYKLVDAQLSFVRDAAGKVTALVLHQNGRDQRAERR